MLTETEEENMTALSHAAFVRQRQHVCELVSQCTCNELKIQVCQDGDRQYLQVSDGEWTGRKWMLSPHMVDGEVVQTALMAVLAWYEHETREAFKFKGCAIFNPHISLDELFDRANTTEGRP